MIRKRSTKLLILYYVSAGILHFVYISKPHSIAYSEASTLGTPTQSVGW